METVIEISDLTVYYDDVLALDNISLTVNKGDFLTIIGPNGGGKSTLLKVILGIIEPTSGRINIKGTTGSKEDGVIGYIPQFSQFDRSFPISVVEVVLMGRLTKKSGFFHKFSQEDLNVANNILLKLDLFDLKNRQIGQLSGGQLQRVMLARALAGNPEILILDEPTASVDSESKTMIYELLKELNNEKTIVLVTHDTNVIASYSESIACLNKQLHYHGKPNMTSKVLEKMYGCPVELIAHGIPHRVLAHHLEGEK
ncbi:metal ABC transporter ATP-binding protein [Bacillus tuaregi]|uniref:metal ABC transporter ATP-binding protein n=1 Tax=Bacillus tuaregi TaxID=1816695 RepID=UPI0008F839ED|nr:metal ABC transporter ATP-binding protein [Bacillus tuaregi]